MPDFQSIISPGAGAADATPGQAGAFANDSASTSARLYDAVLGTAGSIGREAQLATGSIAGAALDALNSATAVDGATAVAAGVVFAALESRNCMPGLVRQAAMAMVASNMVLEAADFKKWGSALGAATDVWHSGKNMDRDIAVGRQTMGKAVVDNLVLASGLLLGGRLGGSLSTDMRPFAGSSFASSPAKSFQEKLLSGEQRPVSALPNLSRPAEGDSFRYFAQSRIGPPNVYRWPANGKPLRGQTPEAVQRFQLAGTGTWMGNHRQALIWERSKGWFDESSDEISPSTANSLIERMLKLKGDQ